MQKIFTVFAVIFLSACNQAGSPGQADETTAKQEVTAFLNHYGDMVERGSFDSLWVLYEKEGAIRSGMGYSGFESLDSIKKQYAAFPQDPGHFEWINPRIDLLSPGVAMIISELTWVTNRIEDTARSSYTGIVRKTGKDWLLVHEHETWDLPTTRQLIAVEEKAQQPDSVKGR